MTPDGRPVHTATTHTSPPDGKQLVACSCPYPLNHPAGLVVMMSVDDDDD